MTFITCTRCDQWRLHHACKARSGRPNCSTPFDTYINIHPPCVKPPASVLVFAAVLAMSSKTSVTSSPVTAEHSAYRSHRISCAILYPCEELVSRMRRAVPPDRSRPPGDISPPPLQPLHLSSSQASSEGDRLHLSCNSSRHPSAILAGR